MANNEELNREICCSFCGKAQDEARRLIAGPGVYICDECIELCMSILEDEANLSQRKSNHHNEPVATLLKPKEIKALLDEYVIGQDDAKARSASYSPKNPTARPPAARPPLWRYTAQKAVSSPA